MGKRDRYIGTRRGRECPVCGSDSFCSVSAEDGFVWCRKAKQETELGADGQVWKRAKRRVPGTENDWELIPSSPKHGHTLYAPSGEEAKGRAREWSREQWEAQRREEEAEERAEIEKAREIWEKAGREEGGGVDHLIARAYFGTEGGTIGGKPWRGRGIPLELLPDGKLPPSIRFASDAGTTSKGRALGRAVLCAIRMHEGPWAQSGGGIVGLQRILLDPRRPMKRAGESAKVMVGRQVLVVGHEGGTGGREIHLAGAVSLGGSVRGGTLAITEGVETGLAVLAATGWLTVAVVSTSGMQSFEPPAGLLAGSGGPVRRVVVCGDHDGYKARQGHRPGVSAARMYANARRGKWPGVTIDVAIPDEDVAAVVPEVAGLLDETPAVGSGGDGRRGPRGGDQVGLEGGKGVYLAPDGSRVTELPEGALKSVDWLDVLLVAGPEGVRRGIDACLDVPESEHGLAGEEPSPAGGGGGSVGDGDGGRPARLDRGVYDDWEPEEHNGRLVLPTQSSLRARLVLMELFAPDVARGEECWHLRRFGGEWFSASRRRGIYTRVEEKTMAADVRRFLDECYHKKKKGEDYIYENPALSLDKVADILGGAAAHVSVRAATVPCWVEPDFTDGRPDWSLRMDYDRGAIDGPIRADRVITFPDGLMDAEAWAQGELRFLDPSPRWFTTACLPWRLPPEAAELARMDDDEALSVISQRCPTWTDFRADLFEDDEETISLFRRFCGLVFVPDTTLQTALWLQGLSGTGKGTLMAGVREVFGTEAVATPSMTELGERFGLPNLIGRNLIEMSEVRVGKNTDAQYALERLLKLISGDPFTIEDKHLRERVNMALSGKVILTPNEDPGIRDEAQALMRRLRVIYLERVFGGTEREKIGFAEAWKRERVWMGMDMLIGLRQVLRGLAAGDHPRAILPQPARHAHLLEEMRMTAAPMREFVQECCVVGPGNWCCADILINKVFEPWARDQGMVAEVRDATFTKRLRTGTPGIRTDRRSVQASAELGGGHRQQRVYVGIRPKLPDEIEEEATEFRPCGVDWSLWRGWEWPYKRSTYESTHGLPL